jgi:hypothetical protein
MTQHHDEELSLSEIIHRKRADHIGRPTFLDDGLRAGAVTAVRTSSLALLAAISPSPVTPANTP